MRLYRALLRAYPASFRAEYGEGMCAVFARRLRDADGFARRLALWLSTRTRRRGGCRPGS